jgi:hypothetical protein
MAASGRGVVRWASRWPCLLEEREGTSSVIGDGSSSGRYSGDAFCEGARES